MLARVARLKKIVSSCFLFSLLTIFSAYVAYTAVTDSLYKVFSLRGWIFWTKKEHSNSFRPTHLFGSVLNLRWLFASYAFLLFLKLRSNIAGPVFLRESIIAHWQYWSKLHYWPLVVCIFHSEFRWSNQSVGTFKGFSYSTQIVISTFVTVFH